MFVDWEMDQIGGVFMEQVICFIGFFDLQIEICLVEMQVDDLLDEVCCVIVVGMCMLVIILIKCMVEDLIEYLYEQGICICYMYSDIDMIEWIEILCDLWLGVFDVLVGINLLCEGFDIFECGLVVILDVDKEGFLCSEILLIQIIGWVVCNVDGCVIMYVDCIIGSMECVMVEIEWW